jgi:putative ABC transport system substrate-binding protein
VAPSFGVELSRVDVRDPVELSAPHDLRSAPETTIVVTGSTLTTLRRDLIITLAARLRIPAVYPNRLYATSGGSISYGPSFCRSKPARRSLCRSRPQRRERRPPGARA